MSLFHQTASLAINAPHYQQLTNIDMSKQIIISKKNKYDTKIGAINYLVKNSVYSNEWSGAGMYEAIVEVVKAPKKFRFSKDYLNSLLKKAEEF